MSDQPHPSPRCTSRAITPTGQAVRFLVIGRILGPVGVSGEVRAQILTDFPDRFLELQTLHVGDNLRPYRLQSARLERETVLLKLAGISDLNTAQALAGQDIQIPIEQAVELPPDTYFWHQIVGLDVWTTNGQYLGTVSEVLRTGSNDVYVVGKGAQEILIPAIADVICSIDLPNRRMTINLIPGLADQLD